MSGAGARRKGGRFEREIVALLQDHGLAAERIPLSGAAGGSFGGDVSVPVMGTDQRLEAKIRASGFAQIYQWMGKHYGVVIRRDRDEPLICIRLKDFARLNEIASRNEAELRPETYHLTTEATSLLPPLEGETV